MTKNMRINVKNIDGAYDTLHPETNENVVIVGDGTLKTKISSIDSQLSEVANKVNTLELVDTSVKITDANNNFTSETLDGALNELFTDVSDGKTKIATAITGKGISTSSSDTFNTMVANIGKINTGKKCVTGTFTLPKLAIGNSSYGSTTVSLGFIPSVVLIRSIGNKKIAQALFDWSGFTNVGGVGYTVNDLRIDYGSASSNKSSVNYQSGALSTYDGPHGIKYNGFSYYEMATNLSYSDVTEFMYIAYE